MTGSTATFIAAFFFVIIVVINIKECWEKDDGLGAEGKSKFHHCPNKYAPSACRGVVAVKCQGRRARLFPD